jgi:hypothetical protein
MSRLSIVAIALSGLALAGVSGCASTSSCQTCYPPAAVAELEPAAKPFDGAAYAFNSPREHAANYPAPYGVESSLSIPYVSNYYGPFPRAAAQLQGRPFYQPGPYYYTPTPPYTASYYGYYDTPSYFRY